MKDTKDKVMFWQKKVILLQEKIIDHQRELINILKRENEKAVKGKGGRHKHSTNRTDK